MSVPHRQSPALGLPGLWWVGRRGEGAPCLSVCLPSMGLSSPFHRPGLRLHRVEVAEPAGREAAKGPRGEKQRETQSAVALRTPRFPQARGWAPGAVTGRDLPWRVGPGVETGRGPAVEDPLRAGLQVGEPGRLGCFFREQPLPFSRPQIRPECLSASLSVDRDSLGHRGSRSSRPGPAQGRLPPRCPVACS